MGEYADRITKLKLYDKLKRSVDRDGASESDVQKLAAMALRVADVVGPVLKRVPLTFAQYTEHDFTHSCNAIGLMGKFIPGKTLRNLNALELTMLMLSAICHDLGMVVSDPEKEAALRSSDFADFCSRHHDRQKAVEEARSEGQPHRARMIEDALLAEFFRSSHPERVRDGIAHFLADKLTFNDKDLSPDLARLCESHAWGVRESQDSRDPGKAVAKLLDDALILEYSMNLRYLACCLRLADLLDFDSSRTPLAVFQQLDFTEEKSWREWMRHLQVRGKRITESKVVYACEFTHTALYVAANEFLDAVDAELRDCHYLVDEFPEKIAKRYALHLPHAVDRRQVRMADPRHVAGAFRFQLEYDDIMRLLMDKSLYPDPSLFLRELLQNSLDACRHKEARWKEAGKPGKYKPRLVVWDHSDDPDDPRIVFQDNGMGMSLEIVENYFMRVGKSYYRSPAFVGERQRLADRGIDLDACSTFGIGILSCFLVADRFEVETYRFGGDPLRIHIEGPGKYFLIERLDRPELEEFTPPPKSDEEDGPPRYTGTRVIVHLRPGVKVDAYELLDTFAVNVDYEIRLHAGSTTRVRSVGARRWQRPVKTIDFPHSFDRSRNPATATDLVARSLSEVLMPSYVPLHDWQFSRHLHGRVWFWLLRDDNGDPCASRGCLQIVGDEIRTTGLPVFIADTLAVARKADGLSTFETGGRSRVRFLFYSKLGTGLSPSAAANAVTRSSTEGALWRESMGRSLQRLHLEWGRLLTPERQAFATYFRGYDEATANDWFVAPDTLKPLLEGNLEWAKASSTFRSLSGFPPQHLAHRCTLDPQVISLHGILVPAGVLSWAPATGESEKFRLLPCLGGVHVDVRGAESPHTSASRLYFDEYAGEQITAPLARAFLRHAWNLVHSHGQGPAWRAWLSGLFLGATSIPHWPAALLSELPNMEERLTYLVTIDGRQAYLTRDELVGHFGPWVPVGSPCPIEGRYREGILIEDALTSQIAYLRPRRVWKGHTPEVDMMNVHPYSGLAFTGVLVGGLWQWERNSPLSTP